jgi:hypothetical protein
VSYTIFGASFDKSKSFPLFARIGEAGQPIILSFVDTLGNPYPISGNAFELPVRRFPTDDDALFTLTEGDGLSVFGAAQSKLLIEISSARSNQRAESMFWRLIATLEDHTWLNGPIKFHNGEFLGLTDDISNSYVTIVVNEV